MRAAAAALLLLRHAPLPPPLPRRRQLMRRDAVGGQVRLDQHVYHAVHIRQRALHCIELHYKRLTTKTPQPARQLVSKRR